MYVNKLDDSDGHPVKEIPVALKSMNEKTDDFKEQIHLYFGWQQ